MRITFELARLSEERTVTVNGALDAMEVRDSTVSVGHRRFRPRIGSNVVNAQVHRSRDARRNQDCVFLGPPRSINDESVVFVETNHCDRVVGRRFLARARRFEFAKCLRGYPESALTGTGLFGPNGPNVHIGTS